MHYLILSTAFFLGGIVVGYWLHNQYHLDIVVGPVSPPVEAPLISVCIPARNEARNIRACVEGVLAQEYPNLEIIVLDDRSTDRTSEILRDLIMESRDRTLPGTRAPRLHILNGSELPPGWAGKHHALYQASAAARGEWLCFIDADTFLAPETLSSCYVKALETNADMFTIMTFQILDSFWEKTVMPLVMTALSAGFSPRKVNDPKRKDPIANGQFIMIKCSVYDAIADLFISIHVTANRKRMARGIETYFQSIAVTDSDAMMTAARENAMTTKKMSELRTEIQRILADLTQADKTKESSDFAEVVQMSLVDSVRPHHKHVVNLGVKQAFFNVLTNTQMPSMLAEVGFISNPHEEKLLRKSEYRQAIAEALFEGIRKYVEKREPQMAGL